MDETTRKRKAARALPRVRLNPCAYPLQTNDGAIPNSGQPDKRRSIAGNAATRCRLATRAYRYALEEIDPPLIGGLVSGLDIPMFTEPSRLAPTKEKTYSASPTRWSAFVLAAVEELDQRRIPGPTSGSPTKAMPAARSVVSTRRSVLVRLGGTPFVSSKRTIVRNATPASRESRVADQLRAALAARICRPVIIRRFRLEIWL